jgi:hypothetical protein
MIVFVHLDGLIANKESKGETGRSELLEKLFSEVTH